MKKTNIKAFISGVLIFLCLSVLLYSCQGGKENNENQSNNNNNNAQDVTDPSEEDEIVGNIYEQFPKTDFGGREFKMLLRDSVQEEHYSEGEIGEVFNDAVYKRNKKIEEDYNINFKFIISTWEKHTEDIRKSVMANDRAIDLGVMQSAKGLYTVGGDIYKDWNKVPSVKENLGNPWWNRSVMKDLSIGGRIFGIAGDVGYSYVANTQALMFNKNLFRDSGMEIPYQTVNDGKWTYEAFENLLKDCTKDLNSDGKLSVKDDMFGIVSMTHDFAVMYFHNSGGKALEKDGNDYPVFVLGNEKNVKIIELGYRLLTEGIYGHSQYAGNDDYTQEASHIAFRDGRAYFVGTNLNSLKVFRDMESEYGIVPYPKFDNTQPDYISTVDGDATLLMLPKSATDEDGEFVGTVIEALARESLLSVIPAYYKTTLQLKFTRDDETIEMLELLRRTANFDMGYLYNFESSGRISKTLIEQKSANLTSWVEKNEPKIQKAIDSLIELCENMD